MKVFISADLEGISGVVKLPLPGEKESDFDKRLAMELFTADVNAAVRGAADSGADRITVLDNHGGCMNFLPDRLHPAAEYIEGPGRPCWITGLDAGFDAMLLVGHHAMAGTPEAVLSHSFSSRDFHCYYFNGQKMGEIGVHALIASHYDIPVIFQSGDRASCMEAKQLLGDIEVVEVKKALSRTCASIIAPGAARKLILDGVKRALARVSDFEPLRVDFPAEVKIEFNDPLKADEYEKGGWTRIDGRTVVKTARSGLEAVAWPAI